PFVGDFLAAWGGPSGGWSAHMMSIIYQSGAERKTVAPPGLDRAAQQVTKSPGGATKKGRRRSPGGPSKLPLLGSNQDSPDPESGVLPVTPRGIGTRTITGGRFGLWKPEKRARCAVLPSTTCAVRGAQCAVAAVD